MKPFRPSKFASRRKICGYDLFLKEMIGPNEPTPAIAPREISLQWRTLSEEDKARWNRRAKELIRMWNDCDGEL